jgi:hypothetical protein
MYLPVRTALMLLILGMAAPASAQEYCVICSAPEAKYRCSIGGEPSITAGASRGQLLCITELARTGGHASCSVGRNTSDPCEGEPRTVMFPDTGAPAPVVETEPASPQPQGWSAEPTPAAPETGAAPPPTPEPTAPPQEEQGSGNPLGNAMQKSWDCVSSLFSDC